MAIKERRKAEKLLKSVKSMNNLIRYKRAKAKVRYVIKQAKSSYWLKQTKNFNKNTNVGSIWNKVKKLNGNDATQNLKYPSLKPNTLMTDQELADTFATTFHSLGSNDNIPDESLNMRQQTLTQKRAISSNIVTQDFANIVLPFSIEELSQTLHLFKCKKSSGPDTFAYPLLTNLSLLGKEYFLKLLNLSYTSANLPKSWKEAWVKPIPKPGKEKNSPLSYRQICLGNAPAKILEKLIANRLTWYLTKNKIITNNQLGFQKGHNCLDLVAKLVRDVEVSLSNGKVTIAIFIDFMRAFDLVWVDGLLLKLTNLGIPPLLLSWIDSFLHDRKYKVKINNSFSSVYSLDNGTPQGSCLSPILFLIMMNDFPKLHSSVCSGFFADDSTIWESGSSLPAMEKTLQSSLNIIGDWCKTWGFVINTDKTEAILFNRKKNLTNIPKLYINNSLIKFKPLVKMLGMTLDCKLHWKEHIIDIKKRTDKSLNILRQLTHNEWSCSKSALLSFYKSTILSKIQYGDFLYAKAATVHLKQLDSIQYKSLLLVCHGQRGTSLGALLSECGEKSLQIERKQHLLNFAGKLQFTRNPFLRSLLEDKNVPDSPLSITSDYAYKINALIETFNINDKFERTPTPVQPPWLNTLDCIDIHLSSITNNNLDKQLMKQTSVNYLEKYINNFGIFVDAGSCSNGNTGIGLFFPGEDVGLQFRVEEPLLPYSGELQALVLGIKYSIENNINNAVIYSDCLNALKDIKTSNYFKNKEPRPSLVAKIQAMLLGCSTDIKIVWIPTWLNMPEMSQAHILSKTANNSTTACVLKLEFADLKFLISKYIDTLWPVEWDSLQTGAEYKTTMGFQGKHFCTNFLNPSEEILLGKFRLCCVNLNFYKFKTGLVSSPLCSYCMKPDDVRHFLTECILYGGLHKQLISILKQYGLNLEV